jgi:hypothetical protein
MKKVILISILAVAISASAQSTKDILLGGAFDLVKTDNQKLFGKAQFGIEGNYFIVRHFAVGAGLEQWTAGPTTSFMMGARWYPTDKLFVRFRGLIGANDATAGVGWSQPFKNSFRLEAMGDFYFGSTEFALRIGGAFVLKAK